MLAELLDLIGLSLLCRDLTGLDLIHVAHSRFLHELGSASCARIGVDCGQIDNIVFNRVEIDDLIAAATGGIILDSIEHKTIGSAAAREHVVLATAHKIVPAAGAFERIGVSCSEERERPA